MPCAFFYETVSPPEQRGLNRAYGLYFFFRDVVRVKELMRLFAVRFP